MAHAGSEILDVGEQTNSMPVEHREPLLRTKLFVPPVRSRRVTRRRLFEQLNSGLDKALILICAPAGYGKTTLVSGWLNETGVSSSWLSLDEDDNDPIRFLQYFITALQKIVPAIQLDLLGMLQDTQPASYKFLLNMLINEVARGTEPFVLIFDDFQCLHAQPVLEMFAHLLEYSPPQMHVVLLSRSDPPLPLSRLRARDQLMEIRADQLRFTQDEIAVFLNQVMGLDLSAEELTDLERRTEGWIAGLQLASIALQATASQANYASQGSHAVRGFVSAFTGSHYYIMDYLVEEVLRLQPDPVRSFLLQSSILERMCGALCDAVIEADRPGTVNGQAMLEDLEQMNLFIIPLDSERRWYRYHHLFADVLTRRLEKESPQILPELHRRASGWHEQNGFISEAVQHAQMAGDQERAAQLVDQNGCLLLMRGEVSHLLHWIEAVEPYSQTLPWIAIQKAWALCLTGQLERVEEPLHSAEGLISSLEPTDDVRTMSGAATAARALRANMLGKTHLAADLARQALECLPDHDDLSCSLRSVATSILGDASWMDGDLEQAIVAYTDAMRISRTTGNIHMVIITYSNLADILMEQGRLQQAARNYSEILHMATQPDGQISPLADRAYAGLARISYQCNRLEDAAKYIQECIELSRRWENFEFLATAIVMSAELERVHNNPERVREAMQAAEQLVREHPLAPYTSMRIKSSLARLWIAQGNPERASELVQQCNIKMSNIPADGEIPYLQEPAYLSLLRLQLARGETDAALALSERLLNKLEGANRVGRLIETLVLQALAYQGMKDTHQAVAILEKAFALGQAEGYTRVFLDEGEPMAKLLYQARSHKTPAGYAAELLSAMGNASGSGGLPAKLLIDPLTLRELEVLRLIEAGYSNQEIAAKFVISVPTVKRHISNIYTKLGVSSRTQAVARGKELNLFQ